MVKEDFEFANKIDHEEIKIEKNDLEKVARCLAKVQEIDPNAEEEIYDKTLNILLLGQTGCGKSTFINSFHNYMRHHEMIRNV